MDALSERTFKKISHLMFEAVGLAFNESKRVISIINNLMTVMSGRETHSDTAIHAARNT